MNCTQFMYQNSFRVHLFIYFQKRHSSESLKTMMTFILRATNSIASSDAMLSPLFNLLYLAICFLPAYEELFLQWTYERFVWYVPCWNFFFQVVVGRCCRRCNFFSNCVRIWNCLLGNKNGAMAFYFSSKFTVSKRIRSNPCFKKKSSQ